MATPTVSSQLPRFSYFQLLNLCIGIIGIQFSWSMQIALSSRVLEPLGANPFLFGLIWCAGPITGLLVQPIVGAISDRTVTKLGRRRPFILIGALLGALALLVFPFSPTLLMATIMIWVIDLCVNVSQGPYRALIPDNVPSEQQGIANSFLNFAFGAGSAISLGVAPVLKMFNIPMSIEQQYIMSAIALILFVCYTSLTIREQVRKAPVAEQAEKTSIWKSFAKFWSYDREIHKLCGVQFLTWIGIMCMFIYLTPFVVHSVYKVPDMSTPYYKQLESIYQTVQKQGRANLTGQQRVQFTNQIQALETQKPVNTMKAPVPLEAPTLDSTLNRMDLLKQNEAEAVNTSQLALVAFNIVTLLLSIPLGVLSQKLGKKLLYSICLSFLVVAFIFAPWVTTPLHVIAMMACAGVAWATVLSIPFAFLCDYIPAGEEGVVMGIFNIFITAPQLLSATVVGWVISQTPVETAFGMTHQWSIAFTVASVCVFLSIIALQFLKEKRYDASAPRPSLTAVAASSH